jgi:hypothetical protein
MASKANKNHDDDAALSSSSIHSPYNLRRNQSQRGRVTKKNTSVRPKHGIRNVNVHTSNSRTNSAASRIASNQSQSSTSDDEEIIEDNNIPDIELSDAEPEAAAAAKKIERQQKKLPAVKDHFQDMDDNNYLCKHCTNVSIC